MSQEQTQYPDPEVMPKARRRRLSAEYKLRVLAEADACTQRVALPAAGPGRYWWPHRDR